MLVIGSLVWCLSAITEFIEFYANKKLSTFKVKDHVFTLVRAINPQS
jgi:hypothetical protein